MPLVTDINYNEVRGNKIKDMIIYLTSNCNLKCTHCYLDEEQKEKMLDTRDLQWIRDTFAIKNVNLIGGEPFLYPHLEEAVNMFDRLTLTTNGVFLATGSPKAQRWLDIFKQKSKQKDERGGEKLLIQLSIEGNEQTTDDIRGKGVWGKVISTAKLLRKNNIGCYFRCTYHDGNLNDIPWLIDNVCQPLKTPLLLFPQIGVPPLTVEDQIWLFKLVIDKNTEHKSNHAVSQPHFMQWLGEPGRCGAGSERLCVTYNKEIIPCHFDFDYYLGKIGTPLPVINQSRETFLKTAKRIHPDCVFCNKSPVCRSGCYMSNAAQGCPLKGQYSIERHMFNQNINMAAFSSQVNNMKGLLRGSLIC